MRRILLILTSSALLFGTIGCEKPAPTNNAKAVSTTDETPKADDAAKAPGQGDDAAAKEKDIRKLLDLTGSGKIGVQVMEGMIANFKTSNPNVPDTFWDEFKKEASPQSLVDMIVPIYDKHFTHDDIKGLIAFYEGDLGKKITATMPQITQESMAVGQKWGMELGLKIQNKLKEQGAAPGQGGAAAPAAK